jgi:hypothetical protein
VTGQWFSPGPPVLSTNKIDHHDIAEILLKVALNTRTITLNPIFLIDYFAFRSFDYDEGYFWNNLHQVRFWNNLHQVRSKSKD